MYAVVALPASESRRFEDRHRRFDRARAIRTRHQGARGGSKIAQ